MVYPVKKQQHNWLIHRKDSKYNFETNQWTSGGIPIDSSKWKNISSPYNEGKRYFPIMNDRLIWRMWNPANIGERYLWSYGPYHENRYDSDKFYLQIYSSTDLVKSSCDENELFTSKIKCLEGRREMKKVWRSQKIISGYYLCRDKSSVSVGTPIDLDKACPDGITSFLNSSEAFAFQEAGFQNFNHSCGYLL